ncbi:hypothetical protein [Paraburkholderia atlantica]|uniref:hypothetical protein n=1 Tax=Paraburkholderia atlantica TaxID=2654982 RepID=UPI001611AB8C|nr:hypothetical protein [Paraburkholderia atlantica]MBB5504970.1 hypothetical protein [Paraburkholderia atlantica]
MPEIHQQRLPHSAKPVVLLLRSEERMPMFSTSGANRIAAVTGTALRKRRTR